MLLRVINLHRLKGEIWHIKGSIIIFYTVAELIPEPRVFSSLWFGECVSGVKARCGLYGSSPLSGSASDAYLSRSNSSN